MRISKKAVEELRQLEDRRGRLTPAEIVDAARSPSSALHACFEWDDAAAAERWRLEQAREILRTVRLEVTVEEREIIVPGYLRDQTRAANESGYVSTLKVRARGVADTVLAEIEQILGDLSRLHGIASAKQSGLPDGFPGAVESISKSVSLLRDRLVGKANAA